MTIKIKIVKTLSAVVLSFLCLWAAYCNPQGQNLREAKVAKLLTIEELSKRITEKQEFLDSCRTKYEYLYQQEVERERAIFAKKYNRLPTQEEVHFLERKIEKNHKDFVQLFEEVLKGDISCRGLLSREMFNVETPLKVENFDSIKLLWIRAILVHELLKELIKKYEEHIQEFVMIKQQLNERAV